MAFLYHPKKFFRYASKILLREYFQTRSAFTNWVFDEFDESKLEVFFSSWLDLPSEFRRKFESDFQEICALATEGGIKAIVDEANASGENLTSQFAQLRGSLDFSFWTFLHRPRYWQAVAHAHGRCSSLFPIWRKTKNLLPHAVHIDQSVIERLQDSIAQYLGDSRALETKCKIDHYTLEGRHFFFAAIMAFADDCVESEFRQIRPRAFRLTDEITFVFAPTERSVDISTALSRTSTEDLQKIFVEIVLQQEMQSTSFANPVLDLNPLQSSCFQFIYPPSFGIENVLVTELQFRGGDSGVQIDIKRNFTSRRENFYKSVSAIANPINEEPRTVRRATIRVEFACNTYPRPAMPRNFDLIWPNACSLGHDGTDIALRNMLMESGIEIRS